MRITQEQALQLLSHDEVVAIPTETVYGLAAHLYSEKAIEKIFELKKRPRVNPLIIHVKNIEQALSYMSEELPLVHELMARFWPGPLTLILPIQMTLIPSTARANLDTAAFRMPNHPILQGLLNHISPLVAPSANLSGKPSATRFEHIEADFGDAFPILDGGPCQHGLESTILAYIEDKWMLARHGAISQEALQEILGYKPNPMPKHAKPISPGQMFRHYAPHAHLYLTRPNQPVATIVGFSDREYPSFHTFYSLGKSTNAEEVSHHLYRVLRQLDEDHIEEAVFDMDFPHDGLWSTIRERIIKAASKI